MTSSLETEDYKFINGLSGSISSGVIARPLYVCVAQMADALVAVLEQLPVHRRGYPRLEDAESASVVSKVLVAWTSRHLQSA